MRHPGLFQRRQLVVDVGQLGLVGHALGLDLQDGDLVEQLAERHGNGDFGHGPFTTGKTACSVPPSPCPPPRRPVSLRPRRSEENTSEHPSTLRTSYSDFLLNNTQTHVTTTRRY